MLNIIGFHLGMDHLLQGSKIVQSKSPGFNRGKKMKVDAMGPGPAGPIMGQDGTGMKDQGRNNGSLRFDCGNKGPVIKGQQWFFGLVAGAFRVQAEMDTLIQGVLHALHAFSAAPGLFPVHQDGSGGVYDSEKGDSGHLHLGQGLVGPGYPGGSHGNIDKAIVVGDDDAGATPIEMLFAPAPHRAEYQGHEQTHPASENAVQGPGSGRFWAPPDP